MTLNKSGTVFTQNPATEETLESYDTWEPSDAIHTVNIAYARWKDWRQTDISHRGQLTRNLGKILRSNSSRLSELISKEMGKPINQSKSEIEKCAKLCDFFCENAEEFLKSEYIEEEGAYIVFAPIGPVLGVMPWNFPFWQVFRAAVPTILAGNTFALKHASNVFGCAFAIEEIFLEAGFPEHVFINLPIHHSLIENVLKEAPIAAATLTGSEKAGSSLGSICGREIKKTVLELGGSDPYIVFADADIGLAAKACVESRLINSGQSCIAAKRWIVDERVMDGFVDKIKSELDQQVLGDPLNPETTVGPLARQDLRQTLSNQVEESLARGARKLFHSDCPKKGFYNPIQVLTDVGSGQPIWEEESFGPVAALAAFSDEDEAINMANASDFGLAGAIFTRDLDKAHHIALNLLEVGTVAVNDFARSNPKLPFGGIKKSGYGRELSSYGMQEFVNIKVINLKKGE